MYRHVRDIPGMNPDDLDRLITCKIKCAEILLYRAAPFHSRIELSRLTLIEPTSLLNYANAADMFRINRVGPLHVYMLRSAEVNTVRELAECNPWKLHERMWNANKSLKLFPPITWVKCWIAEAKAIPKLITYR